MAKTIDFNGGKYVGETNDDGEPHGQGKVDWEDDGESYEGHWVNGNQEGQGTKIWPDGSTYVGEWVNNRRQGKGSYEWAAGDKYDGDWFEDKRH
eukprot:Pgem_evm1s16273